MEEPKALKPLSFHGVDFLDYSKDQVPATCPFCGKNKFFARHDDGRWDCKVCGRSGNPLTFLEQLWQESTAPTEEFARDRSVLDVSSLVDIGVQRSMLSGEVIVPAYGADGKIDNLYTYLLDRKIGKRILYPTPDFHAGLFGASLFNPDLQTTYIVEGPWKVAVLREVLARAKRDEDGALAMTSNTDHSMLANANVIGVPGCNTWHESWNTYVNGKDVVILFDSDHPREVNGRVNPPSGWDATRRLTMKILDAETIHVLRWGPDGYNATLPSGYDLRDAMSYGGKSKDASARVQELQSILSMVEPIPEDWIAGRSKETIAKGGTKPEPPSVLKCDSWESLVREWRKGMMWSEGLDRTLSVMLASVLSTQMIGDQLWIKVISPPSTGKTQLCDGLGTARKLVKSVGNFTGLHSGFQTDAQGEEDHSLLAQIKDMTLVVKDGDTLLKSPNRDKILSQIRDAYDMNCAVSYGNRVKREYHNHRFTFILAGTEALLEMDSADLGARYLDCIIMHKIDHGTEMSINERKFHQIYNNRGIQANGAASTQDDEKVVRAKAMTGGYVEYLRENAGSILMNVEIKNPQVIQEKISAYAQFIAHVRARPSKTQEEAVTREMSARLNSQLTKLAICTAGVMGKKSVDKEVMRRVRQVAIDTARGKIRDIVMKLAAQKNGMEARALAIAINHGEDKTRTLLRFFKTIEGVETFEPKVVGKPGSRGTIRWKLTSKMREIYNQVF